MKKLPVLLIVLLGLGFLISANAEVITCPTKNQFRYDYDYGGFMGPYAFNIPDTPKNGLKVNSFIGAKWYGGEYEGPIICEYKATFFGGRKSVISVGSPIFFKINKTQEWQKNQSGNYVCNKSNRKGCPFHSGDFGPH